LFGAFEAPNFEYLDPLALGVNSVALLDKYAHKTLDSCNLKKCEVVTSLLYIEKTPSSLSLSNIVNPKQKQKFILVGAATINLDENFASQGRLIIFELLANKIKQVHSESL
jgi:hypothetical protein